MRAVSVLEVDHPDRWGELAALVDLDVVLAEWLSPTRRVASTALERQLDELRRRGLPVLVRYARAAPAPPWELDRPALEHLPPAALRLLWMAQRRARGGEIFGPQVWDPEVDQAEVSALFGAGVLESLDPEVPPRWGRYRLHPDLTPPPARRTDFEEARMPPTEDLAAPRPGPVEVLHDMAALSAALTHHRPRRTAKGALDRAACRRLGDRLASAALEQTGLLEREPRWLRALSGLEALGVVRAGDDRCLYVEPGLEDVLEGTTAQAVDRLVRRLVDPDLHPLLEPLQCALAQAGEDALDELILLELLERDHRDLLFSPWWRQGLQIYPMPDGRRVTPWTADAFAAIEGRLVEEVLVVLVRLGLIRRAPGVIQATADGRLWATGGERPAPPLWLGSDLVLMVPPDSLTPWERYQVERLARCLGRDVVDRYRLDPQGVEAWLATHELAQALDLLRRRSAGVPPAVEQALSSWAASASRFVWTRGVLVAETPDHRLQ